MRAIFKKIPLKFYILGVLLVAICLLWNSIRTLRTQYNRFYINNGIGNRIMETMLSISGSYDRSFLPDERYPSGDRKEVAIGDTPFETQKLRHYNIRYSEEDYYYIEGIKSQCLFDLPLLRPSLEADVKNTILLCDMMQRCIINYSEEKLVDPEDCKNMNRLMREFLFIWYDNGGTYVPDIHSLGDVSRSGINDYGFLKKRPVYTLNDIESNFRRFNAFLEGEGAELFQGLLEKYSPRS